MARKWNTDTFTFCVVKRNMRNRVLSLAIPLNILTRQLRNNDMGDGFYYDFFHVWLQRVRLKKKWWVLKLALVSSVSLIMVALENTDFFLFTSLHFDRSSQRRLGIGGIKPVEVHRGACRVFGNGTDELGDQVEWRKSKQTIGQEGTQTDEAAGGSACMQTVRVGDRRTDRRM